MSTSLTRYVAFESAKFRIVADTKQLSLVVIETPDGEDATNVKRWQTVGESNWDIMEEMAKSIVMLSVAAKRVL